MARIGMLTPSSNTVLEPVTMALAQPLADVVSVHFSRFRVTVIADSDESHQQFDDAPMLEAARLLADARVDGIVWNGTSGAWEGLKRDRTLVGRIQAETAIPATTATLSLLDALRLFEVRRVGLVVPYVDAIVERIKATLAREDVECVAAANEGLTTNFEFALVSPERIAERVREVVGARPARPEAVVIHCTNLRGAGVVPALEEELGIPVFDSVAVAFWGALCMLSSAAGVPQMTVPGAGMLLQAGYAR